MTRTPTRRALLEGLRDLIEHCEEGREPVVFIAGTEAFQLPGLQWAAKQLGVPLRACHAGCDEPKHVVLLTRRVRLGPSKPPITSGADGGVSG